MNIKILNILLNSDKKVSQRQIANELGVSLGKVNHGFSVLLNEGYIDNDYVPTKLGKNLLLRKRPQRAVILAAGYGMRMVPINTEEPKGLLEVNNEPLIERIIKQLHEVAINEIYIVVGFMKEHYEYLIDKYNVKLLVNSHYSEYKNMYSLGLAKEYLNNSYIVPCDIWFKVNPFSKVEDKSWYLFSKQKVTNSIWNVGPRGSVKKVSKGQAGDRMVGVAYVSTDDAEKLSTALTLSLENKSALEHFWEKILEENGKFSLNGKLINQDNFREINSYEELRDLDFNSSHLQNDAIQVIEDILKTDLKGIKNIRVLKKGMTNRSFFFENSANKYIMRIPGKGTDELINREWEYETYKAIRNINWTENILYLDPNNGYKLSSFIKNAHNCNSRNFVEVSKCMSLLRKFHTKDLKVNHKFDLYGQIKFYETLRHGKSAYRDYLEVKKRVLGLKSFIENHIDKWVLCHIDANADNFIFDANNRLYLIDWEYAGMQDPDLDIAMFAIYAMYDQKNIDRLIDIYYQGKCDLITRYKIYAYIAVGGLLWSNWCEYKQSLGLDFGEYSIAQYRYAKGYSKKVLKYLGEK